MVVFCRRLVQAKWFSHVTLGVILFNALLVGLETDRGFYDRYSSVLYTLNYAVLAVFVLELIVRMVAHAPHVGRFFKDGWNVFDFLIVVASFIPAAGPFATMARVARVLRVMRVVSAFPELRLIVATMLRSIPSMGHVVVLAGLLIYIWGVTGTFLFRDADPAHWGSLGRSCLTLFQVMTTEGWADIQNLLLPTMPWAWIFFTTYIVIAVFVVVNLFIAVVTNNLQAAKMADQVETDADSAQRELLENLRDLRDRLDRFEAHLRSQKES